MRAALLALMLAAACARPLTETERAFAATIHGPGLDMDAVRLHRGNLIGGIVHTRPPRPAIACRERIRAPETGPVEVTTAALVLFNTIFLAEKWWREDYLPDYPERVPLPQAMLLAHELTHVWQWQNRARTGYHPLRAAAEHEPGGDPYLYELDPGKDFLDYGFEQQGALVEEYVCCRALAPEGGRTRALRALLASEFAGLARTAPARPILPPVTGELDGICQ